MRNGTIVWLAVQSILLSLWIAGVEFSLWAALLPTLIPAYLLLHLALIGLTLFIVFPSSVSKWMRKERKKENKGERNNGRSDAKTKT